MTEKIHISPDGVKYRLVATKTTTPTTDSSAKEIIVDSATIEVIVSDSRLRSMGSQWGHVAIDIDGTIYSRAHEEYVRIDRHTYFYGGVVNLINGSRQTSGNLWRDNVGLVLRVSPTEKEKIKLELERRVDLDRGFKRDHPNKSTYSIFDNSCSSNVADALESIGILAHDPRWLPTPVTPAELGAVLKKSKRLAKQNYYPKQESD
jgi:hypothetical protein